MDDILNRNGLETAIYAEYASDKRIPKKIHSVKELLSILKPEDFVLYHLSTGTKLTDWFKNLDCRKALVYHNITPPEFFEKYDAKLADVIRFGRSGIQGLMDCVEFSFADSEYNKQELEKYGFQNVFVLPFILDFKNYQTEPDKKIVSQYQDGKKNILFVGRIAPNKKQEDLIITFDYYKKQVDSNCRLILVGSSGVKAYSDAIKSLIQKLGTEDVVLAGHVTFQELIAYYKTADLFFCMSEHEGFCVPLIESMYFGVPIVAYDAAAVPETLGDGGIVFTSKKVKHVAALMHILLENKECRKEIIKRQKKRLETQFLTGFENQEKELLRHFKNKAEK